MAHFRFTNSHSNKNSTNHQNNSSTSANQSSATWVTNSRTHVDTIEPPLYQSPQFQNEFPSLDGSAAPAQTKGNRGGAPNASGSDVSIAHSQILIWISNFEHLKSLFFFQILCSLETTTHSTPHRRHKTVRQTTPTGIQVSGRTK